MKIKIRRETLSDFSLIDETIVEAFKNAEHASGDEHNLVKRLRKCGHYIPELSLIAELDDAVIGHIMFSKILIRSASGEAHGSLALAPVSVRPDYQGQGIGSALIEEGHRIAASHHHASVVLLGYPEYYSRFGYQAASRWGIKAPFDVPDDTFMALELTKGALDNVSGVVEYPSEFFG